MLRRVFALSLLLFFVTLWAPGAARADGTCGAGMMMAGVQNNGSWTSPICVPSGDPSAPPAPAAPRVMWQRYWGALAFDSASGVWYNVNSYYSESKVKLGVLNYCDKQKANCKVQLTYSNQCAAVARVVENGREVVGKDSVNTGSTKENAGDAASRSCSEDWGGKQCRVILSGCSVNGTREVG